MYYPAELIVKNYKPLRLEKGMMFVKMHRAGTENEYLEIYQLPHSFRSIHHDQEFIEENGYPVELYVLDMDESILATPEQIGWWDAGEDLDELRDITIKDINYIIQECDGMLEIEIDDDEYEYGLVDSIIVEDKVILRGLTDDDDDGYEEFIESWDD